MGTKKNDKISKITVTCTAWFQGLQDWNIIAVGELWTLQRVLEGLANKTESDQHDEENSWTLDTAALCGILVSCGQTQPLIRETSGLPLVCKVRTLRKAGLSVCC